MDIGKIREISTHNPGLTPLQPTQWLFGHYCCTDRPCQGGTPFYTPLLEKAGKKLARYIHRSMVSDQ